MSVKERLHSPIEELPEKDLLALERMVRGLRLPEAPPGGESDWPRGFFEGTAGSLADEPLSWPPQPAIAKRRALREEMR